MLTDNKLSGESVKIKSSLKTRKLAKKERDTEAITRLRRFFDAETERFRELEDRRVYHPEPDQRYQKTDGAPASYLRQIRTRIRRDPIAERYKRQRDVLKRREFQQSRPLPYTVLAFKAPKHTLVCLRRKARRAAIHAFVKMVSKTGAGRGARKVYKYLGNRTKHYTATSLIHCLRR